MGALLMLLPTLIPTIAPILGRLFAGSDGERVGNDVAGVVRAVVGSTDEAEVSRALSDPDKAGQVLVQLNTIAAQREAEAERAKLERFKAALGDTANARDMTGKSRMIAWAQVSFGSIIIGLIAANTLAPLFTGRVVSIDPLLAVTFGTVMGFFFGNSTASNAANNDRAALAAHLDTIRAPQAPQAAPIATTGDVVVNNPPAGQGPAQAPSSVIIGQPSPPGTSPDELMGLQGVIRDRIRVRAGSSAGHG